MFFSFVYFVFQKKKIEKLEKYKSSVCFVYFSTCVPWMAIETKFSKLCIICNLDEHLYAQLSKWALWLLFVMSKIKLSLVLNTRHSKSAVSMTSVCFGKVKVQCQKFNLNGYFFSISYMPMHVLRKRKICKEKSKAKRSKML